MGTKDPKGILACIQSSNWRESLGGVADGEAWIREASPGDPSAEEIARAIAAAAKHEKWEVRRAVTQVSSRLPHRIFDEVVTRCRTDDNLQVRRAAEHAALRRRDWRAASVYGQEHEAKINSTLDHVELRLGPRGRDAARRAGDVLAETFAKELYHEVVKLLTPLSLSVERLEGRLRDEAVPRSELRNDAQRIHERVARVQDVMDAMREYAATPRSVSAVESLGTVVREAVSLVADSTRILGAVPPFVVEVPVDIVANVVRTRLVQALTNLLVNAVESYEDLDALDPITITATAQPGGVRLTIADSGCGMCADTLKEARVLFATSKANGTGFGLPLTIKIIESEHNGRLSLNSEEGRGTTAVIELPTSSLRGR